jgi:glutathione peroxidase-family protein
MSLAPGLIRFTDFLKAKPREGTGAINWNFTKFLVDRGGLAARFAPAAAPEGLEKEIEKLL